MPTIPPNQKVALSAPAIDGKRTRYSVEGVPGLQLDVTPAGARTWRLQYSRGSGAAKEVKSLSLGSVREVTVGKATDKVRELRGEMKLNGTDPKTAMRGGQTFGDLFSGWFERHAKVRKKSWEADEGLWRRNIAPRLANTPVATMKRQDVVAALNSISDDVSPIQANRSGTVIQAVLNWAVDEGLLEVNPAHGIRKRGAEQARSRVLTDDELRLWWNAELSPAILGAVRLLMLTGQRCGEVAGMVRSEVELVAAVWELPAIRVKNNRAHEVPLTPVALGIVRSALGHGREHVFQGRTGGALHSKTLSHLPGELRGDANWTMHDIRRTCKTRWRALGVSADLSDRLTNHVAGRSIGDAVYNWHEFREEKRAALIAWEAELLRIVATDTTKT